MLCYKISTCSQGLADNCVVAKVDNVVWDLDRPFEGDCHLQLLKFNDEEAQVIIAELSFLKLKSFDLLKFKFASVFKLFLILPLWFLVIRNRVSQTMGRDPKWGRKTNWLFVFLKSFFAIIFIDNQKLEKVKSRYTIVAS